METLLRVLLGVSLLAVVAFGWTIAGRGRWRAMASDRLLYGIPWGTIVTVVIVVCFYLVGQRGLYQPTDPVVWPYVSSSLFYPTGLVTAGIAHASLGHLVSNLTATVVLAPIAEYAWGHYPGGTRAADPGGKQVDDAHHDDSRGESSSEAEALVPDGGVGPQDQRGVLARPWVRALVVFPGVLISLAVVSAVFSLGPGLGFSGVVFAIIGFALVTYPVATVVATVATSALGVVLDALASPIVQETVQTGPPTPPGWAGIGFHAHILGFLIGVVTAVALLRSRDVSPDAERLLFATLAVGLAQTLWLLSRSGDGDVWYLLIGPGVMMVAVLSVVITLAVTGTREGLLYRLTGMDVGPVGRTLAIGFLVLVTLGMVGLTIPFGLVVIDGDAIESDGEVTVDDYTVTYEENVSLGREFLLFPNDENENTDATVSGLLVINEARHLGLRAERPEVIAYDGDATVTVGGFGWHETVEADRSGWDVTGNETAFVVDLTHDGETTRSYATDPVTADVTLDGHEISVVPTDDAFEVRVTANDTVVGQEPIPDVNASATIGDLSVRTEVVDDRERLIASVADSSSVIAERETY